MEVQGASVYYVPCTVVALFQFVGLEFVLSVIAERRVFVDDLSSEMASVPEFVFVAWQRVGIPHPRPPISSSIALEDWFPHHSNSAVWMAIGVDQKITINIMDI